MSEKEEQRAAVKACVLDDSPSYSKWRLVESVVYTDHSLSVTVRAHPEKIAWCIRFPGLIGYRVFDERDLLPYWPTCSREMLYEILEGGWLPEVVAGSPIMAAGFYGEVFEYLVAGEDMCVNVVATDAPVVKLVE